MAESKWIDAFSSKIAWTVADWRAAGLSTRQLRGLVSSGELVRIRYGGYAASKVAAEAESDRALRHALEVAASGGTRNGKVVASHKSAAMMWRLSLLREPAAGTVTLTVPPGTRIGGYARAGVVRHTAELPDDQVTKLYGLPVTTAARTVIDIARASTFMEGVVVADSALYERRASKTELRRVLARCTRWRGIAQARSVVDFANSLAESPLESCARVAFRQQNLPPPELQVPIFGQDGRRIGRVDFFWRPYSTVAEADGLLKYRGRDDAIKELKRDRLLREAGYEVVHFTWKELFGEPARVAGRIRSAFGRGARTGGA
jgi:predicted transcriptional regulator of viral defense system